MSSAVFDTPITKNDSGFRCHTLLSENEKLKGF